MNALEIFVPGTKVVRVEDGMKGVVFTAPAVGATGAVCFGVRLENGENKIGKETTFKTEETS